MYTFVVIFLIIAFVIGMILTFTNFMKKTIKAIYFLLLLICAFYPAFSQNVKGDVITDTIYSKYLENSFGENPNRKVKVYLPPGYKESNKDYPVIYFLHGFTADSSIMEFMVDALDLAILKNKIRPFILVVSDQKTTYGGSFYSNNQIHGNWEDFTVHELVSYMDTNYRTIANRDSRGITGHSMGGYGALKIAMQYPEVFSSVYALSPSALAMVKEYGGFSNAYKKISKSKSEKELKDDFLTTAIVALGKSWSPNPESPPFYCDFPFEYKNEELILNDNVLKKWFNHMPYYMIEDNFDNLKQLKAIKLDWGRNAPSRFIEVCKMFSQKLESLGITHFAEEYIGNHVSHIYTTEGRIPNQMLPFFDSYLDFGDH